VHPINTHRPRDVLERLFASILEGDVQLVSNLVANDLADTDSARLGDAFKPGRDVHAIAVNVAALDDDVTEVDADAKFEAGYLRLVRIALCHGALHFDRAAHGVHDAGELEENAVARGLDQAASVLRDLRVD
jgi:hypothetical protein